MERSVRAGKPFFLYYPITQIHFPTLAHPDFAGKTGAGDIGDAMADVDHNAGLVLDAIERLGIAQRHHRHLVHGQRRRNPPAVAWQLQDPGPASTTPSWRAACAWPR